MDRRARIATMDRHWEVQGSCFCKNAGPAMPPRPLRMQHRPAATGFRDQLRHALSLLLIGLALLLYPLESAAEEVVLDNGDTLNVEDTPYNRRLPYAFYDQAMASLAQLFPRQVLLAARRSGAIGDVRFSLVCYRESPSSDDAIIQAIAVRQDRAWNIALRPSSRYGDALVQVLEYIGRLSSGADGKPGPAAGAPERSP